MLDSLLTFLKIFMKIAANSPSPPECLPATNGNQWLRVIHENHEIIVDYNGTRNGREAQKEGSNDKRDKRNCSGLSNPESGTLVQG